MKRLLFVIIDGGADTPHPELDGKTPFEAADIPNLNNLARLGISGIMQVLPIAPESDEAVLSLLGYDVFKIYTGRGPLEAIGGGANFKDGNLAIRCNFATLEDGEVQDVRAGKINTDEARQLAQSINEFVSLHDAEFEFQSTAGYRGVLIIKSKNKLSARISNTHPGYITEHIAVAKESGIQISSAVSNPSMKLHKCLPLEHRKEAVLSANLVNEFIEKSKDVLEKHPINIERVSKGLKPANIILTRDAGNELPKLTSFRKLYDMNWACFADMPVERGISQLAGMQVIPMPEVSKDLKTDMLIRSKTLIKNLTLYDAIYIHLKGPDVFSHIGDIKGKVKAIEAIDKYFFGPILESIDIENTVISVTCDHTTSTEQKVHTADPVPLTIFGPGVVPDNVPGFNEKSCRLGSLKYINAIQLMPFLMKIIKR